MRRGQQQILIRYSNEKQIVNTYVTNVNVLLNFQLDNTQYKEQL